MSGPSKNEQFRRLLQKTIAEHGGYDAVGKKIGLAPSLLEERSTGTNPRQQLQFRFVCAIEFFYPNIGQTLSDDYIRIRASNSETAAYKRDVLEKARTMAMDLYAYVAKHPKADVQKIADKSGISKDVLLEALNHNEKIGVEARNRIAKTLGQPAERYRVTAEKKPSGKLTPDLEEKLKMLQSRDTETKNAEDIARKKENLRKWLPAGRPTVHERVSTVVWVGLFDAILQTRGTSVKQVADAAGAPSAWFRKVAKGEISLSAGAKTDLKNALGRSQIMVERLHEACEELVEGRMKSRSAKTKAAERRFFSDERIADVFEHHGVRTGIQSTDPFLRELTFDGVRDMLGRMTKTLDTAKTAGSRGRTLQDA